MYPNQHLLSEPLPALLWLAATHPRALCGGPCAPAPGGVLLVLNCLSTKGSWATPPLESHGPTLAGSTRLSRRVCLVSRTPAATFTPPDVLLVPGPAAVLHCCLSLHCLLSWLRRQLVLYHVRIPVLNYILSVPNLQGSSVFLMRPCQRSTQISSLCSGHSPSVPHRCHLASSSPSTPPAPHPVALTCEYVSRG